MSSPDAVSDKQVAEHHFLRARPLVQAVLQHNPNDVDALIAQSTLYYAFNQYGQMIAAAEKALAVDGSSAAAHAQLVNALGAQLANSSAGFMTKLAAARRFHSEADITLKMDPNNIEATQDMAQFYWHAPAIAGGDKAKAQQMADKLVRLSPIRGYALKALFATDEVDTGKRLAALEAIWKQAAAVKPDSVEAHAGLGAAYLEQPGKLPLAEDEGKRAIAVAPTRIDGYRLLARVYVRSGQSDQLEADIKQARSAVADDLTPLYQAAAEMLLLNQTAAWPRAETYLRTYLAQPAEGEEPTWAMAHWRLALVLEQEGHKDEAVRELQTAVSLDGTLEAAKKDLKRLK